jgi:hypothetical protein
VVVWRAKIYLIIFFIIEDTSHITIVIHVPFIRFSSKFQIEVQDRKLFVIYAYHLEF